VLILAGEALRGRLLPINLLPRRPLAPAAARAA
jgi:hypothetical protein